MFCQDFEACNGIEEVTELIRDKQVDENLRFFVLFLCRFLSSGYFMLIVDRCLVSACNMLRTSNIIVLQQCICIFWRHEVIDICIFKKRRNNMTGAVFEVMFGSWSQHILYPFKNLNIVGHLLSLRTIIHFLRLGHTSFQFIVMIIEKQLSPSVS